MDVIRRGYIQEMAESSSKGMSARVEDGRAYAVMRGPYACVSAICKQRAPSIYAEPLQTLGPWLCGGGAALATNGHLEDTLAHPLPTLAQRREGPFAAVGSSQECVTSMQPRLGRRTLIRRRFCMTKGQTTCTTKEGQQLSVTPGRGEKTVLAVVVVRRPYQRGRPTDLRERLIR